MSEREKAVSMLDTLPDYQIRLVIAYIQGMVDASEDIPNDETIAAINELESGGGTRFIGSTADLFSSILTEDK